MLDHDRSKICCGLVSDANKALDSMNFVKLFEIMLHKFEYAFGPKDKAQMKWSLFLILSWLFKRC